MTASDVARAYSPQADWIPAARCLPPAGEAVRVLYADGVELSAERAGRVWLTGGLMRYVEVCFWRPGERRE